jgi:hypothetical protein
LFASRFLVFKGKISLSGQPNRLRAWRQYKKGTLSLYCDRCRQRLNEETSMPNLQTRLIWAASETLRPIVRRLLEMGVPFGALEISLRDLFVRVAESELAAPAKRQTDSRIALVTGINRKEIKRIRSAKPQRKPPQSFSINQATSLISRWRSDPETTDGRGRPLPLPYRSARGASFMKLARKLTGDLAPGVLLKELVRSGTVEVRERNVVLLRDDTYVPKVAQSGIQILGEDAPELIETILRNIFAEGKERLLQRKVYYDNLGSEATERIRTEIRREGERFLRRIDRLLSRYDRDRNPHAPGGDRRYAALGIYFLESPYRVRRLETPRDASTSSSDTKKGNK